MGNLTQIAGTIEPEHRLPEAGPWAGQRQSGVEARGKNRRQRSDTHSAET